MILTVFKLAPHTGPHDPFIHIQMVAPPGQPNKRFLEVTLGGGLTITTRGLYETCMILDSAADAADRGIDKLGGLTSGEEGEAGEEAGA